MANQRARGLTCKTSECSRPANSRGMCKLHYEREFRAGTFTPRAHGVREQCGVEGCDLLALTRGLCKRHYERHRKYGDPLHVNPTRVPVRRTLPSETNPTRLAKLLGVSRQRAHQLLHKQAHQARIAVATALKAGHLIKPDACERCDKETADLHAHHWDYREELDVRWVCASCHGAIHALKRKQQQAA